MIAHSAAARFPVHAAAVAGGGVPVGTTAPVSSSDGQAEGWRAVRPLATVDSLAATLATRAGVLVLPEPEREAAVGRVRAFPASRPETAVGDFTPPMLTGVLRVRRLGGQRSGATEV